MKFDDIRKQAVTEWEDFNRLEKPRILIGAATCGRAAGADAVRAEFEKELAEKSVDADIVEVGCLGMCYAEPLVEIGLSDGRRIMYRDVSPELVSKLVGKLIVGGEVVSEKAMCTFGDVAVDDIPKFEELPMIKPQVRVVLRNAGHTDPTNVNHYLARDGYKGLVRALGMTQQEVCDEVKASGLRGRGGAGFPTGVKWGFALRSESDQKYMICNADEGDPGAFMDRAVLESDPHAVLEGLAIGAYAIGATKAIVYARAEYPLAIARIENAIRQMKELGFLGENIMGTGFNLDIKIKMGAGAFVCGEETSLMASIEGKRGMPRPRPPFPAQAGLHGKPTNINNVETLANVSAILYRGAEWFAGYGTEKSRGTKTFALAGKIKRTGLIEVPMGITIHEIIFDIGGGIPKGKKFKAVQTGGPSGGSVPARLADLKVDYDELAKVGSIMGSGGMIVMDNTSCMVDVTRYFLDFTHSESCGKCVPCRMGSQHLLRLLTDIIEGRADMSYLDKLEKLAKTVKNGSLCGLGQTMPNPVLSALRFFKDEFVDHIRRKRCDAMVCKSLISSPCQYTCPINQDVPVYIGHIARGHFEDAIRVVRVENPLPGICGRVCPHPCERNCEAGKEGDPIAIRALKRFASSYERRNRLMPEKAEVTQEQKIAIVGSGPAGLAAAYYLQQWGYQCTIFEKLGVPGGMLAVGIPEYRLPWRVLDYDINYIKALGVEIKTRQELGKDFTIGQLKRDGYDAVFLAVGAHKPFDLPIEGAEHESVLYGVKFLADVNRRRDVNIGDTVAVIGGGNVAVDSARTALRLGAKEVFIVYRRAMEQMPALEEEIEQLQEEGIEIKFLAGPKKVVVKEDRIIGLECVKMELGPPRKEGGRPRPIPVDGSDYVIECDTVIVAIGQTSSLEFLENGKLEKRLETSRKGTLIVDRETNLGDIEGVFAGGDMVTGPLNVVTAISHGKIAARSIRRFLSGRVVKRKYRSLKPCEYVPPVELTDEEIERLARPAIPHVPGGIRKITFDEVEERITTAAAVLEAKRCLRCDLEALEHSSKQPKGH